jgi:RNA polymerase sigma-70 factor, ECF subfamily
MNEIAGRLDGIVSADRTLEQEFEAGLADWTRLAFRIAYSVLRHREDAEDVAQEAVTKAHAELRQLRDRARLKAWLGRMAWRMALDRRESAIRRVAREERANAPAVAPTSEDEMLSAERSLRLWRAIDSLSEKLRVVVVLCSIEEHDLASVAAMLEIPEGTVKSRLFEARQQLRERLK